MTSRGQCLISCAPLRAQPTSTSEQVSQILYGECVAVLETIDGWIRIRLENDGYEGWISANQLSDVSFEPSVIQCVSPFVRDGNQFIPLGAWLPKFAEVPEHTQKPIDLARKLKGAPYLWGGKTFMGMDCSGLMQVIHLPHKVRLPRDSSQQALLGTEIPFGMHKAGDLAFFHNSEKRIMHVGILTDNSRIIHASGTVREDDLSVRGIEREDGTRSHDLAFIKRL